MPMKVREVIRKLEAEGWSLVRVSGSHHVYKRGKVALLNFKWVMPTLLTRAD